MPSYYQNQCWIIANWTHGNKLQWNWNQNIIIFIHFWMKIIVFLFQFHSNLFSGIYCLQNMGLFVQSQDWEEFWGPHHQKYNRFRAAWWYIILCSPFWYRLHHINYTAYTSESRWNYISYHRTNRILYTIWIRAVDLLAEIPKMWPLNIIIFINLKSDTRFLESYIVFW